MDSFDSGTSVSTDTDTDVYFSDDNLDYKINHIESNENCEKSCYSDSDIMWNQNDIASSQSDISENSFEGSDDSTGSSTDVENLNKEMKDVTIQEAMQIKFKIE
uniref:Uncharacterized protein n=1 Tax=viral metagenome TaxID=1070528 RepID=A0A6C0BKP7_9ZZZZ